MAITPNMNLPVSAIGQTPAPEWAQNVNTALSLIDGHDHTAGRGAPITPAGLSITADLPFNGNNATALRSTRFTPQVSPISGATDLAALSVSGVDLYYRDASGNNIRITQSGGIAGSPGSITGLVAPATAVYSPGLTSFIWQQNTNIAAAMDNGSVTVREMVTSGNGVTLEAPTGLASNYALTLPAALPASTRIVSISSAGVVATGVAGAVVAADLATDSVVTAKIQDAAVTRPKLAAVGQQVSSTNAGQSVTGTAFTPLTGLSIVLTTIGRPVLLNLTSPGGGQEAAFVGAGSGGNSAIARIMRSGVEIARWRAADNLVTATGNFTHLDQTATTPGTYTYSVELASSSIGTVSGNGLVFKGFEL